MPSAPIFPTNGLPAYAIIVIAEEGVELFADVAGLTTIQFERGRLGKRKRFIMEALTAAYQQARKFYEDDL